jgi:hypothetical protein
MSRQIDQDGLTSRLRALPVPEPPADFPAAARRRYLEAIAADRRHAVTGLVTALVALVVTAILLALAVEPAALVGWLAEATADLARWTAAVVVVMALVPLPVWTSAVLGSIAAMLSLVVIARSRGPAVVKAVK